MILVVFKKQYVKDNFEKRYVGGPCDNKIKHGGFFRRLN